MWAREGRVPPELSETAVAPAQLPDEGGATAVAPQQLSDAALARQHVHRGVLSAQRGPGVNLHDVGTPVPGTESLPLHERRLRAWHRVALAADVRLRRAVRETVRSVEQLQFEVGAIPPCLSDLDERIEPTIARLTLFADAWLYDADYIAWHNADMARERAEMAARELAEGRRPSSDSEPEPAPNAAGSSSGP